MAKLTDDERKLLDELTARAAEPDADEDFEIEVYDTTNGKGARLPFSKGSRWLFDTFGIGEPPAAPEPGPEGARSDARAGGGKKDPEPPARQGYFGRQAG
jgi:hypothetical protein